MTASFNLIFHLWVVSSAELSAVIFPPSESHRFSPLANWHNASGSVGRNARQQSVIKQISLYIDAVTGMACLMKIGIIISNFSVLPHYLTLFPPRIY